MTTKPNEALKEREAIIAWLQGSASFLRTPIGRRKAEWYEAEANMVANELDLQARLIATGVHHQKDPHDQ